MSAAPRLHLVRAGSAPASPRARLALRAAILGAIRALPRDDEWGYFPCDLAPLVGAPLEAVSGHLGYLALAGQIVRSPYGGWLPARDRS